MYVCRGWLPCTCVVVTLCVYVACLLPVFVAAHHACMWYVGFPVCVVFTLCICGILGLSCVGGIHTMSVCAVLAFPCVCGGYIMNVCGASAFLCVWCSYHVCMWYVGCPMRVW